SCAPGRRRSAAASERTASDCSCAEQTAASRIGNLQFTSHNLQSAFDGPSLRWSLCKLSIVNCKFPPRAVFTIRLPGDRVLALGERPLVMGIVNVTPDSSAGGLTDPAAA